MNDQKRTANELTRFQDRLCQEAKGNLQQKLEEFGNDYFYSLGLNTKFCNGIEGFMKNNSMQSNFRNE